LGAGDLRPINILRQVRFRHPHRAANLDHGDPPGGNLALERAQRNSQRLGGLGKG
jgi:hypothetical protein